MKLGFHTDAFNTAYASFEACLKNQDLYDNINKVRDRAAEKFQVR